MTDLNKIIEGSKSIEHILSTAFDGTGRGMREKLDSARYPIPQPLKNRIAYLARERNRCVHEADHAGVDADEYLRKCRSVCAELQEVLAGARRAAQAQQAHQQLAAQQQAQQQAARASASRQWQQERAAVHARKRRRERFAWRFGAGALVLAGAWWFLKPAPQQAGEAAAVQAQDARVQPGAAASAQAQAQGHGRKREAARARDARPAGTGVGNVGIGNDVLAIESVEFAYRKGSFGDAEPRMRVTVRNLSDRTISMARLDGRLYLGDEANPVVDTSAGGWRNDPLYLFLGDRGLAPGARVEQEIHVSSDDRWKLPDVINASRRRLLLRVKEVEDGRKQAFGAAAPAWPASPAGAGPAAPRQAAASVDAETYRRRFLAGKHVVLSDSRLEIDRLELRMEEGFGSRKPVIRARFANHAGVTLSSATFRVQLFVKGETKPLADSQEGFSSENLYAFFDSKGLADGASVVQDFSSLHRGNWDAPDVGNAIRTGQAQLVIRLESLSDGRKRDLPGKATAIRAM